MASRDEMWCDTTSHVRPPARIAGKVARWLPQAAERLNGLNEHFKWARLGPSAFQISFVIE